MGTYQSKQNLISEKLQTVYEAIKRERPWDIRPVENIYTTAKEKYMIELIKDGHDITDDTIGHVVGRCYKFHHFDDEIYVCWFGFILTRMEYPDEHFKCKSFHNLNKRLICSNGGLYYPVDILSNPFGDRHPSTHQVSSEIQEVYTMIEEKWADDWYDDEMHKYTLKHLINEIDKGKHIPKNMKQHVVNGCSRNFHELDDRYRCYSGFLLREEDLKGLNSNSDTFHFHYGSLDYVMNTKFYDLTGITNIPIPGLRLRRYQTSQKITDQTITSTMTDVNKLYERIYQRDLNKPQFDDKFRLTWQETYLMNQIMSGEDFPNEVISHVLDGCYTWSHHLTDKYACCRGYILNHNLMVNHDVRNCINHHMINKDLKCYKGRVYHRNAEIPKGYSAFKPKGYAISHQNIEYFNYFRQKSENAISSDIPLREEIEWIFPARPPQDYLDDQFLQQPVQASRPIQITETGCSSIIQMKEMVWIPRLPIFPARPPQDHLDDQFLQQPVQINIPVNGGAQVLEQNDGDLNVIVNEPEDQAARQNARHNQASPPPEIEI